MMPMYLPHALPMVWDSGDRVEFRFSGMFDLLCCLDAATSEVIFHNNATYEYYWTCALLGFDGHSCVLCVSHIVVSDATCQLHFLIRGIQYVVWCTDGSCV